MNRIKCNKCNNTNTGDECRTCGHKIREHKLLFKNKNLYSKLIIHEIKTDHISDFTYVEVLHS